jgi:hypothetical protein
VGTRKKERAELEKHLLLHPCAVLQRLGQMSRLDVWTAGQIRNRPRQFEDAVVGARGKLELVHGGFDQAAGGIVQGAVFAYFGGAHIGIAGEIGAGETLALDLAGGFDAGAHGLGGFTQAGIAQFFIFHARDVDVNVNAVEERTGDALLVFGHYAGGAGAGFDRVAVVTAGAGVHGGDQLEGSREGERAVRAADGDDFIFDGLAHHFQNARAELGQLIQQQPTKPMFTNHSNWHRLSTPVYSRQATSGRKYGVFKPGLENR